MATTKPLSQHDCAALTCAGILLLRHRPWDMVLVCYGFPSQVSAVFHAYACTGTNASAHAPHWCPAYVQRDALQFEWAWQHPHVSIAVRDVAATLPKRGLSGLKGKVCIPDR